MAIIEVDESYRTLPANLEAERSVLGAILVHNEAFEAACETLKAEDFFRDAHRRMFEAMVTLYDQRQAIDFVTLKNELGRKGDLDEVGGPAYVASLADGVPRATNVEHYAKIVKEKATLRSLIYAANKVLTSAYESEMDAATILDSAESEILAIGEQRDKRNFVEMHTVVSRNYARLEQVFDRKGLVSGVATGFTDLDEMTRGLQSGNLILIGARPSMGKAQPVDAKVMTPSGWRTIGEVVTGDVISAPEGGTSTIVGVFDRGERQVYRVTLSDGRSVEACAEHLWEVRYRTWSSPRVLTTAEISVKLTKKRYQGRLYIDPPHGVEFGVSKPVLSPWFLGVLLGDGCFMGGSANISVAEPDILARVSVEAARLGLTLKHISDYDYRISGRKGGFSILAAELRGMKLAGKRSHEKHIPEVYFTLPRHDRVELLRGLMDTDGYVDVKGCMQYTSTSRQLADDVQRLAWSLGAICYRSVKVNRSYLYKGARVPAMDAHSCTIIHPRKHEFVTLGRKKSRATNTTRQSRLSITSVAPTRVTRTRCISTTHPSGLYVTDEFVVTHNTSLVLNIAQHVGQPQREQHVGFFSLEMSESELFMRMLASEAQIDSHRIMSGALGQKDFGRMAAAMETLRNLHVHIDDTANITLREMRSKARRLKNEHGLHLLIVDYIQLMESPSDGRYENRTVEVGKLSRGLKGLAKELGIPVVVLTQLSRNPESRSDHRPQLSDLRESGSLEQDADVVILVYRDDAYNRDQDNPDAGMAELIVAKQRNGPTGVVKLAFLREQTRFANLAPSGF